MFRFMYVYVYTCHCMLCCSCYSAGLLRFGTVTPEAGNLHSVLSSTRPESFMTWFCRLSECRALRTFSLVSVFMVEPSRITPAP